MAAKYNILKALEFDKLSAATRWEYGDVRGLVAAGWWTQRKYDGVFGRVAISPTVRGTGLVFTRTDEVIVSADHVLDEIVRSLPSSVLTIGCQVLGELWHPSLPFPIISGGVRRHRASPHLKFVINDLLPFERVTSRPYCERLSLLKSIWPTPSAPSLMVAETHLHSVDPIDAAVRWVAEGGYDGAILRDPDAGYTIGPASAGQIVKVKPTLSLSLRVVRFRIGEGEKTGRPVYTAVVTYRGVETTVGAGMPHLAQVCPAVGQIIEVECLGLTADGKLREPRFKGIRHDVREPDA
jgi:ATP-dependent DNA ligase